MKASLFRVLSYPILQTAVYCLIISGSVYFYGPLVMLHAIGALYFQWYALAGIVGIVITLCSVMKRFEKLQLPGTILMIVGLIPHLQYSINGVQQVTLDHPVSQVLILLFGIISMLVLVRSVQSYRKKL